MKGPSDWDPRGKWLTLFFTDENMNQNDRLVRRIRAREGEGRRGEPKRKNIEPVLVKNHVIGLQIQAALANGSVWYSVLRKTRNERGRLSFKN